MKKPMKKAVLLIFTAMYILACAANAAAFEKAANAENAGDLQATGFGKLQAVEIDAPSYVLVDMKTGRVLLEKNADEIRYPASTTKIMTAIVAIENGDLNAEMVASAEAVADIGDGGSNIGIMPGEVLTLRHLLTAMLVSSANESANIIAENICAGSANPRQEFISLMNRRAMELGALNTHFVNTCGIHDPDHYTTAKDLAVIARHAMTLPAFRETVKTSHYSLPATNKREAWDALPVTNRFLNPFYGGVYKPTDFEITGIKTGFTTPAGSCLVTSAVNDEGEELLAVVLGVTGRDQSNDVYACTTQLLEWGFNTFSYQQAVPANSIVLETRFRGAAKTRTGLVTEKAVECLLPVDRDLWNLEEEIHWTRKLEAPAKAGEIMGYMEYSINGFPVAQVNVVTSEAVKLKLYLKIFNVIKKTFFAVFSLKTLSVTLVAIALFIIMRATLRFISRSIRLRKRHY